MAVEFIALTAVAAAIGVWLVLRLVRRITASVWTLRARAWLPSVSRLMSGSVNAADYAGDAFFRADGADAAVVKRRSLALARLSSSFRVTHARSSEWGASVRDGFSDIRFADANRVPFPFARTMREQFDLTTVVTASDGPRLCDLDGRWSLDVSGSYGVNVAGFERYKEWMERGWNRVKALGPVLGPVHPIVADNIRMLRAISGLDDVSFHMSGTEAVMAAVRLARFDTGRRLIVCFSGAYHGWWDGVVAGLGSERHLDDCLTLKDLDSASLRAEGVTLSWVGTGRCLSSMDFTAQDYAELQRALVSAVSRMKSDGWWLDARDHPEKEKRMKSRLVQEMVKSLVPVPLAAFYREVMLVTDPLTELNRQ